MPPRGVHHHLRQVLRQAQVGGDLGCPLSHRSQVCCEAHPLTQAGAVRGGALVDLLPVRRRADRTKDWHAGLLVQGPRSPPCRAGQHQLTPTDHLPKLVQVGMGPAAVAVGGRFGAQPPHHGLDQLGTDLPSILRVVGVSPIRHQPGQPGRFRQPQPTGQAGIQPQRDHTATQRSQLGKVTDRVSAQRGPSEPVQPAHLCGRNHQVTGT